MDDANQGYLATRCGYLNTFKNNISKAKNLCMEIAHLILTELCKKILIRDISKITGQSAFHHRGMIVLEDETHLEISAAVDVAGNSKCDTYFHPGLKRVEIEPTP